MNRNKLRTDLEKIGVVVYGTTEDFDGSEGGLWVSNEETKKDLPFVYDTYMGHGVNPKVQKVLNKHKSSMEPYDGGTLMIYPE